MTVLNELRQAVSRLECDIGRGQPACRITVRPDVLSLLYEEIAGPLCGPTLSRVSSVVLCGVEVEPTDADLMGDTLAVVWVPHRSLPGIEVPMRVIRAGK